MQRLASVLLVTMAALAQEAPVNIVPRIRPPAEKTASPEPGANIRVDTNVVLVPATVTDPLNRFVSGLEQSDFRVFENNVEQKILSFGSEDAPLSIGIVFDTSGSMGNKLTRSRQAVAEFFKLAEPDDEGFLVQFSDRPELAVPFTHNPGEIESRLLYTQSKGETALLDAVTLGLNAMKKAKNPRKALIVITDGGDNHSRYTASEVRNRLKEADVQIYSIGIYGGARTPEELAGPDMLRNLAEPTGGRHFYANLEDLPNIAEKIGIELRNEYLIGYTPKNNERDGKFRRITVKVIQPPGLPALRVYWRKGYFAPTQ
ncbi:MAG: VWA domain-containing protein [Acidobacteriota bacterium]|nr:VWA domain-containing protein [Acidobacteriota bacterium]